MEVQEQQKEMSLEESAATLMQGLPDPVRKFVADGRHAMVASRLMGKYQLTQDQGHALEYELLLTVVGVRAPEELLETLGTKQRVDKAKLAAIEIELDDQVFDPLNKAIDVWEEAEAKKEQGAEQKPAAPVAAPKPRPQVPLPSYAGAPPPQSPMYVRPEPKVPATYVNPLPVQRTGLPRAAVTLDPSKAQAVSPGEQPVVRAPEKQEVPKAVMPERPVMPKQPASAPRPVSLPGAVPPVEVPAKVPPQAPVTEKAAPPAPAAPRPVQEVPAPPPAAEIAPAAQATASAEPKAYAADPYREPIEEKDQA